MGKYEYNATYLNMESKKYSTIRIVIDANTKWGAWTKALYDAMEKEDDDHYEHILVGLVCFSYREVNIG